VTDDEQEEKESGNSHDGLFPIRGVPKAGRPDLASGVNHNGSHVDLLLGLIEKIFRGGGWGE
jgi:hypothetical protein